MRLSIIILGSLTVALATLIIVGMWQTVFGSEVVRDDNRETIGVTCNISTNAQVSIGASNDVTVLASSTRRAYAVITPDFDNEGVATTSVHVDFSANTASTTKTGYTLGTTTPKLEFGITTDFPYMGPVQVVTGSAGVNASTSVHVVECTY